MKRILILSVLVLIAFISNAQVNKYKAYEVIVKTYGDIGVTTSVDDSSIITIDVNNKLIVLTNGEIKENYVITSVEENTEPKNTKYYCKLNDELVDVIFESNDYFIYIEFSHRDYTYTYVCEQKK